MTARQKAIVIVNDCMASIDYDTYYEDGFMFGRFITREVIEARGYSYLTAITLADLGL